MWIESIQSLKTADVLVKIFNEKKNRQTNKQTNKSNNKEMLPK